jgi:hypothetical protein
MPATTCHHAYPFCFFHFLHKESYKSLSDTLQITVVVGPSFMNHVRYFPRTMFPCDLRDFCCPCQILCAVLVRYKDFLDSLLTAILFRENVRRKAENEAVRKMIESWIMENPTLNLVDGRVTTTHHACPVFVRANFAPMRLTGSIKGADCIKFVTDAGRYWYNTTLPPPQQRTWEDGMKFMKDLLHATCDADDPEAVPTIRALAQVRFCFVP